MDLAQNLGVKLALILLGALIGVLSDNYVKRPKLSLAGSGGGGGPGPGFYERHVTIQNEPGQIGLYVQGTSIFGKRIHGPVQKGLVFDRTPAHECRAMIFDKRSGERIGGLLWWRTRSNPYTFAQTITLNSGERAELMLFARLNDERSKYFVFEPENPEQTNTTMPKVPEEESQFSNTREFDIRVAYFYGRKTFRSDVTVFRGHDGRLSIRGESGGGSF